MTVKFVEPYKNGSIAFVRNIDKRPKNVMAMKNIVFFLWSNDEYFGMTENKTRVKPSTRTIATNTIIYDAIIRSFYIERFSNTITSKMLHKFVLFLSLQFFFCFMALFIFCLNCTTIHTNIRTMKNMFIKIRTPSEKVGQIGWISVIGMQYCIRKIQNVHSTSFLRAYLWRIKNLSIFLSEYPQHPLWHLLTILFPIFFPSHHILAPGSLGSYLLRLRNISPFSQRPKKLVLIISFAFSSWPPTARSPRSSTRWWPTWTRPWPSCRPRIRRCPPRSSKSRRTCRSPSRPSWERLTASPRPWLRAPRESKRTSARSSKRHTRTSFWLRRVCRSNCTRQPTRTDLLSTYFNV